MKRLILFATLFIFFCSSCGSVPFVKKKEEKKKEVVKKEEKQKGEKIEEAEPKPGDIKVVDGVEYIYVRNRRYMLSPYEPEYVWVRKDQYRPSLGDALSQVFTERQERQELEKRIAKLEEELKKKGLSPQVVYPVQVGTYPMMPSLLSIPPSFSFPSPKMKRKVIVLPLEDKTNYREERLGEMVTRRLITRLEGTGTIICVDPENIEIKGSFSDSNFLRILNEIYGVHAVISGEVSDLYTSTAKIEGKDVSEISFAVSSVNLSVVSTETGTVIKRLSGRNPVSLSREKGEYSSERAKIRAIDLAIEVIAEDLLRTVLSIDWHARIASVDKSDVYINAGRLSGLKVGDILEVYSPGSQVYDEKTKTPIGIKRGEYKGELEVRELFGLDASAARIRKGGNFSPSDIVYLSKEK
jgi:signal peptidase I